MRNKLCHLSIVIMEDCEGRTGIDLVTGLKLPDIGPDPDHIAQHQWKAVWRDELELSISDLDIQNVHTGGVNLHHHVILPQFRLRTFSETQGATFHIAFDQK